MDVDMKFEELFDDDFFNALNIACEELSKKGSRYTKAINRCISILNENKRVRIVCDQKKAIPLSKNDVKILIEYMDAENEENLAYQKTLLCIGFRAAYLIFKKTGMLKE